jgi:hypothetical protein
MEDAMKARYLVVAMVLAATPVAGAKEPLSIRVALAFSLAPANIVIRTSVEPDAENRSMEVIADSAEFYRSSTVTLEGDRAPKTMMVEFAAFHRVIQSHCEANWGGGTTAGRLHTRTSTCSNRALGE